MDSATMELKRPVVGLCLGSGAMRGLSHIGVLEVFVENNIPIDMLSGCSIGSVVGGLYCCGISPKRMAQIALQLDQRSMMDVSMPRKGLLRGKQIQSVMMTLTQNKDFSQTDIPFYVLAADIEKACGLILHEGKVHEAIRASISIPGVFQPHTLGGRKLVDGGVVERVPLDILHQEGADVVFGVDVGYRGEDRGNVENLFEILLAAIEIMDWEMNRQKIYAADFMIVPDVRHINPMTLDDAQDCIEQGRMAARAAMPAIKKILNDKCVQLGYEPLYPPEDILEDYRELDEADIEPADLSDQGQPLGDIPETAQPEKNEEEQLGA